MTLTWIVWVMGDSGYHDLKKKVCKYNYWKEKDKVTDEAHLDVE